ncbi:MAG: hypothetical protein LBF97_06320, partial [Elusimicrobiota bacterium]|nr:hypothetical protein [Elusimicrobiota bacterium]
MPENSWIINELWTKLETTRHSSKLHSEWKKKVLINYNCIKTGLPESEGEYEFQKIFEGNFIGLSIPMENDPFMGFVTLPATIKFEKCVEKSKFS